ncbi:MAG: NADH-quinone oxidoreductase subunit L [Hyphomicrobiales bacterium]
MILITVVILAPLIAALLILLLRGFAAALALAGVAASLLAGIGLLAGAFNGSISELVLPGLPELPLSLVATPFTALLSTTVAVISSLVLLYAAGYMKQDEEKVRFFATMLLFVSAMQTLVLAGDWILLLAAWELIGLSSYLLIGFWYQRPGVSAAATRAFLVTRSADLGLYIAVFILIANAGSSDIATTLETGGNAAVVAGLLLLVAAMGKSAQTPLHGWLQGAMAGPTPVSALLHSATLVAAGAILLIRTAPMLPVETLLVIGIVGGITAVVAGLIALGERDLKRLLAASTSSQYGLMLVAVGAGVPLAALLHLIAHAAIKSSLFLGAGIFQHSRESTALTDLAGAGRDQPRLFFGFTLAALALAGIPPLSGFFSKDAIIAAALASPNAGLLVAFALAGTVLTGAYMARALHILWRGDGRKRHLTGLGLMSAGLAALVTLAVILGATFPAIETLLGDRLPDRSLAPVLGIGAALAGLALGWMVTVRLLLGPLLPWAQRGFAIAGGFDNLMVRPAFAIARGCERLERALYSGVLAVGHFGLKIGRATRAGDERGIDGFIFALVRATVELGHRARTLQSGLIHREMALTIAGTALIFIALFAALLVY